MRATLSLVLSWVGLVGGVLCFALLLISPFVREVGKVLGDHPYVWIAVTIASFSLIVLAVFVAPPGKGRAGSSTP